MHLRPDAGASRAAGLVLLLDDLAEEHGERTEIAGRAEEERHERLAVADPAALGLDGRGGQVRPRRVAGHQVADAGAVVRQQALAIRDARHDQRRVGRVARRHQVLAVAFVPAEGRDAVVVAVQDAGLAARRHRRQDRLPLRQLVAAVADHARHRVDRSGAHPAGQDRVGEPVDLDDHEARLVGMALRALDEQSLDEEPVIGAAAVDAEDRGQDRVDDGVHERGDQGGPEPVDVDARRPLDDDDERDDLEHEDQDPDQDERDRRGERQDDRPDGCVEQGEKDDGQRGARESVDGEARHQPGRHQERDDRDRERQDEPAQSAPDHRATPRARGAGSRRSRSIGSWSCASLGRRQSSPHSSGKDRRAGSSATDENVAAAPARYDGTSAAARSPPRALSLDRSMTHEHGDLLGGAGKEDRHVRRDQAHARGSTTTPTGYSDDILVVGAAVADEYGVLAEGAVAIQGDHALVVARFADTTSARAIYENLLMAEIDGTRPHRRRPRRQGRRRRPDPRREDDRPQHPDRAQVGDRRRRRRGRLPAGDPRGRCGRARRRPVLLPARPATCPIGSTSRRSSRASSRRARPGSWPWSPRPTRRRSRPRCLDAQEVKTVPVGRGHGRRDQGSAATVGRGHHAKRQLSRR